MGRLAGLQPAPGAAMNEGRTHACAAPDCQVQVALHTLMCKRHWLQVPADLRYRVNQTYYLRNRRPEDRAAYAAAVRAAVDAIETLSRRSPAP
jgi:hypothetical protein